MVEEKEREGRETCNFFIKVEKIINDVESNKGLNVFCKVTIKTKIHTFEDKKHVPKAKHKGHRVKDFFKKVLNIQNLRRFERTLSNTH